MKSVVDRNTFFLQIFLFSKFIELWKGIHISQNSITKLKSIIHLKFSEKSWSLTVNKTIYLVLNISMNASIYGYIVFYVCPNLTCGCKICIWINDSRVFCHKEKQTLIFFKIKNWLFLSFRHIILLWIWLHVTTLLSFSKIWRENFRVTGHIDRNTKRENTVLKKCCREYPSHQWQVFGI